MKILENLKENLIKTIYPKHIKCLLCESELNNSEYDFCEDCLQTLPVIKDKVCVKCYEPLHSMASLCLNCKDNQHEFIKNISCFTYEDPISNLIMNLKYGKKKYIAESFAPFMAEKYVENNLFVDLIIPVPLHEARQKERGFNQAELISNAFAKKLNMKSSNNILKRIKNTPKQSQLSISERRANMKDAFILENKDAVKNKICLLIDDVYTTGATLDECAKILKKGKAKEIYCLTVAHAIRNII